MQKAGVAELSPEGTLVLPAEVKAQLADTHKFLVIWLEGSVLLVPTSVPSVGRTKIAADLPARLRRARFALRRLSAFQEAIQCAGGSQKTPEEIMENLRAIRRRLWEEEYVHKYAHISHSTIPPAE